MRFKVIFSVRFLFIYLYAVFILNIISIFYMDRVGNNLDSQSEFFATLIAPLFLSIFFSPDAEPLTDKQRNWATAGLIIACPLIFALHIIFTL